MKAIYWMSILVALAAVVGCVPTGDELVGSQADELHSLRSQNKTLVGELESTKRKLKASEAETAELRSRERRLAAALKKSQFENERLTEQVNVLRDAPKERDQYREEVRRLQKQLIELQNK